MCWKFQIYLDHFRIRVFSWTFQNQSVYFPGSINSIIDIARCINVIKFNDVVVVYIILYRISLTVCIHVILFYTTSEYELNFFWSRSPHVAAPKEQRKMVNKITVEIHWFFWLCERFRLAKLGWILGVANKHLGPHEHPDQLLYTL